jgi:GDP-mannose transporter
MLSATSFTLVGVVNKFITILLNVMVWDKHSTGWGLVAVTICLISGVFYEQPPKKSHDIKHSTDESDRLLNKA